MLQAKSLDQLNVALGAGTRGSVAKTLGTILAEGVMSVEGRGVISPVEVVVKTGMAGKLACSN